MGRFVTTKLKERYKVQFMFILIKDENYNLGVLRTVGAVQHHVIHQRLQQLAPQELGIIMASIRAAIKRLISRGNS